MIFPYVLFLSLVTIQRSWQSKFSYHTSQMALKMGNITFFVDSISKHAQKALLGCKSTQNSKQIVMNELPFTKWLGNPSTVGRTSLSPLIVSFSSLSSADCRSRQSSFQSNNFFCQPSNDLKTQYPNVRGYFAFKFVFGKTWMRCHLPDKKLG